MQMNPYLFFNGDCAEAFKFYAGVLDGEVHALLPYSDSPEPEANPPGVDDRIMHACMSAGDYVLMGSDSPPDQYDAPSGVSIHINADSVADAERIFEALSAGATIQMPIGETFWAERFGALVDRFGVSWMIGHVRTGTDCPDDGNGSA